MKHLLLCTLACLMLAVTHAANKDSTISYTIPDSVKAISFLADINIQTVTGKKETYAGIRTDLVTLAFEADKESKEIIFTFPKSAKVMVSGQGVDSEKGELEWDYNWNTNETYKLLLAVATDSAGNFLLYSGYVWLPKEMKWKLIGTCKVEGQWNTIKSPARFFSAGRKRSIQATINNAWCQRNNGSWKRLDESNQTTPLINLLSHVDSLSQFQAEKLQIEQAISSGQTDVKENIEGVYYKIISEGSGRAVAVTDTVTVHYKGYLFSNGEIFDQTKEKPATFPLGRLIRGWQLGVPKIKIGGKIKLVIPSALAYSIRTRASKIPPNSILVFEIEVLDAKPALQP
jgi:FKBP-type peptidyl-prolyl cis-trans isomerase FkpA